jgi:hypothetical protein
MVGFAGLSRRHGIRLKMLTCDATLGQQSVMKNLHTKNKIKHALTDRLIGPRG